MGKFRLISKKVRTVESQEIYLCCNVKIIKICSLIGEVKAILNRCSDAKGTYKTCLGN